jgi:hypothetical protein
MTLTRLNVVEYVHNSKSKYLLPEVVAPKQFSSVILFGEN